jgi:hypothetical protein
MSGDVLSVVRASETSTAVTSMKSTARTGRERLQRQREGE